MSKSDADTTRAIKAALRKAFPSAKFSVTRGGQEIEWTDDGPEVAAVEETLIAAKCVEQVVRDGVPVLYHGGRRVLSPNTHLWRYNVAEQETYKADMERRLAEREEEKLRENQAVAEAWAARETTPRPKAEPRARVEN